MFRYIVAIGIFTLLLSILFLFYSERFQLREQRIQETNSEIELIVLCRVEEPCLIVLEEDFNSELIKNDCKKVIFNFLKVQVQGYYCGP